MLRWVIILSVIMILFATPVLAGISVSFGSGSYGSGIAIGSSRGYYPGNYGRYRSGVSVGGYYGTPYRYGNRVYNTPYGYNRYYDRPYNYGRYSGYRLGYYGSYGYPGYYGGSGVVIVIR